MLIDATNFTQLKPTRVESPEGYKNGHYKVMTFENRLAHMCYDVDKENGIWDFCYISSEKCVFETGRMNQDKLKRFQNLFKIFDKV